MEKFKICRAGERDAFHIEYLIRSSIGYGDFLLPREKDEIRELIGKGNFFVAVAFEEGSIAGCASLEEYEGVAELRSLVVKRDWRELGIGKKLINMVANLAKERNYKTLYALADESLVGFYKEQGFEDRGKFIGKDSMALDINRETSEKMKRYCHGCGRLKVCTEHLVYKQLP